MLAARHVGLVFAVIAATALWAAGWVDAQVHAPGAPARPSPAEAVSTAVGGEMARAARSAAAMARRSAPVDEPTATPGERAADAPVVGDTAGDTTDTSKLAGDPADPAMSVDDTTAHASPVFPADGETAVVLRAAPRSFLVISLEVPAELPADQDVRYAIVGTGASRLYGRLTGSLPAGVPRPDSLLVTVGVPARALAGRVVVGHVHFRAGAVTLESPLAIEVDAVPQVQLTAAQSVRAVVAGGRTVVSYTAVNVGNVPDSVEVHLELPAGWRVSGQRAAAGAGDTRVVARHALQVRQAVRGEIELAVPANAARGPIALRVHARGARRAAAAADVTIEVIDPEASQRAQGPRATLRAATATGAAPGAATGATLTIDGPVGDGVLLSARAGSAPTRADGASLALAGVGVYRMPPSLSLSAPRWALGVGLTEQRLSDLTGASVSGSGVSASLVRRRWRGGLLAARPLLGPDRDGGALVGARAFTATGRATIAGSASHLAERGAAARRLDAMSVSAKMILPAAGTPAMPGALGGLLDRSLDGRVGGALRGSELGGELAYRRFTGGSGVGWAASVARRGERGTVDLRVTHAPGGSAAFAPAAHEVSGTASRLLSRRLSVSSSLWTSADGSGALNAFDGRGAELGAQYRINPVIGLSVDVRRSSWEVSSGGLRFGGGERSLVGALTARSGRTYATAGFLGGPESRETLLPSGAKATTSTPRAQVRGALGTGVGTGTVSLDARADWAAVGAGRVSRQSDVAVRADRVQLLRVGIARSYVDATVRRYQIGTDAPALAVRSAVRVEFPRALALVAAVERNPFFVNAGGRPGWTFALGVERSTQLPRVGGTPAARGVVFQDLDDDGVRDRGESGFAHVVVRHGAETGVTAADGSFAMPRRSDPDAQAGVAIDPLSLPVGFITGRRSDHDGRVELAAVAVTPVEVRLALSAADSARVGLEQLARAVVVAQDSAGHPWVARPLAPGLVVFEALPPGRYRIDVDLSAVTEPLRLDDAAPEVVVTGGREPLRVTIPLKGRPIRMRPTAPDDSLPPAAGGVLTPTTPA
jgi:hypothetical protein